MKDFLSQNEVDDLLMGKNPMDLHAQGEEDWGAAMAAHIADSAKDIKFSDMAFSIKCGDWIYPSHDSSSRVQYPIDYPLVAEICLPKSLPRDIGKRRGDVASHLNHNRRLHLRLDCSGDAPILRVVKLTNDNEPDFEKVYEGSMPIDASSLYRINDYRRQLIGDPCEVRLGIFVADVLLSNYLQHNATPDEGGEAINIAQDIFMRKASMPEIESIGRW